MSISSVASRSSDYYSNTCYAGSFEIVMSAQLLFLKTNYRTARENLKPLLLPKCFVIYRQVFLTFWGSKNLKLSFTSEIVY